MHENTKKNGGKMTSMNSNEDETRDAAIKNDRKWIGVRKRHTQNQNGGLHKTTPGPSKGEKFTKDELKMSSQSPTTGTNLSSAS
jgi:hypothetical protein